MKPEETFSNLWRDDYLQATSKVACRTIRRLNLEPYSRAVLARGLKARKADDDGEEYKGLERAMEYAGVVGAELADMLTAVMKR